MLVAAAASAVLMLLVIFAVPTQQNKSSTKVKIGTPYDTGGMIIHYLINVKGFQGAEAHSNFEIYPVKDCCSTTSQWALSSSQYDLAIMCPDAAKNLIEKDGRFEIVGPCLVNSDIVVVQAGLVPNKVGVAQNRSHQVQIAADLFGKECAVVPILPSALPYAYEKNTIDGVVVDALTGITMAGDKLSPSSKGSSYITYVLVTNKSFKNDPRCGEFLKLLQESACELNNPDILAQEIKMYKNIELTPEEVDMWIRLGVKHVFTIPVTQS